MEPIAYTGEDQSTLGKFMNDLDDEITEKQKLYTALKHLTFEHQQLLIKLQEKEDS
jgi:hypothetical protein